MFALILLLGGAFAANPDTPHPHGGKLSPYVLGPPTVLLSREDEEELADGKTIMRVISNRPADESREGGARRLLMVRDVAAPKDVVLDRIGDFAAYPRMVKGCDACHVYKREGRPDGTEEVRCEYRIHALHLKFRYFMSHQIDPEAGCVVWNLDYERESDLDDSVGYWYIQPRGRQCCRVYYSCDTKLRKWVPAPVYALLSKTAVKQATIWVNNEAVSEWAKLRQQQGGGGPLGLGGAMRSARDAWERALPKGRAEPWKLPRLPWARPTSLTVRGLGAHPRHLSQC
mmetsp:Transcript_33723/g.110028  ORF Transcript_33723/g.110028 Transcript_33723/m.110028 type:complete len:286 (+) Transcript_33723:58-915(+)